MAREPQNPNLMNDLNEKILQWADDKGILKNGTPEGQMRKVLEEYREAAEAVALYQFIAEASPVLAEHALERVKAELGDQYITLVIHAEMSKCASIGIASIDELTNKQAFDELAKCIIGLATFPHWDTYALANGILAQLAANHGLTLRECVEHSYNVIAKRTGKMENGIFRRDT